MTLGIEPADWPQVSDLLDEYLSLEPQSQPGWLGSLHGDAARHRETLARLLSRRPLALETRGFANLAPASFPSGAAAVAEPEVGSRVGDYRLVELLGRGGMGAVWLADRVEGEPKRRVALKLPHVTWDPRQAERFARERDILATLEHPRIARLYDVGVDAHGRPFLALEHVAGVPIDAHVRRRGHDVHDILRLLIQVADAVGYANGRLVVHRDLKPSNILVTEGGDIRLLDFGIARLLDDDPAAPGELTLSNARALTLAYASPEQIRGEPVDTASDVYSLGVVAYELLTGVRLQRFAAADAVRWAHAAHGADAPLASRVAPAAVRRRLAGDLDAILARALKTERRERYANALGFGEDLQRHLDHQPVRARPDGLVYRTRKLMRRHAVPTAAIAAVTAAVLVGASVSLWQAQAARREAARANEVKRYALSIFRSADTLAGSGPATTAIDLLREAERRIDRELADRPETRVELLTAIGDSLGSQDRFDDAAAVLRKALGLARARVGPDHPLAVSAATTLGQTLTAAGDGDEGPALLADAAERARRIGAHADLAKALAWLSSSQIRRGEHDTGIATARAAIDAASHTPDATTAAGAWVALASALNVANRPGVADAARRAVALSTQASGGRLDADTLSARLYLANGLSDEGQHREGLRELDALLADAVRVLGPNHSKIAFIASSLGRRRLEAGDAEGAVAAFRQAYDTERRSGTKLVNAAIVQQRVGDALLAADRPAEALSSYQTAQGHAAAASAASARLGWQIASGSAWSLVRLGRLAEADKAFATLGGQPLDATTRAIVDSRLSELRRRQGRPGDALVLAERSAAALAAHPAPPIRFAALQRLGEAQLAAGRPGEAAATLRGVLERSRERQLQQSPWQVAAESTLAAATAALAQAAGQERAASAPRP